jgi:D-alanyl-lipoteichoic acid acyltransferase DltB (MBOAT superfamily)
MKRLAATLGGALVIFAALGALAFYTGLYRSVLDPFSSTGSFEGTLAQVESADADPTRDVLVLGDSRIYAGLDPWIASYVSGNLRFINAGVPGTTPRCWYFFDRAVDPTARRFRAIVIPVDTYADDDGAIGSIDGDQHEADLHYIALRVEPGDVGKLAASFPDPRKRFNTAVDLLLRGPELRDDVQAFAGDPRARLAAIARARRDGTFSVLTAHPRLDSLAGMRVDFTRNEIAYPANVSADERREMALQVLRVAQPSPSYARYRRRWLGPLVERYRAAGVPVIFVRLPARPAHRALPAPPSGTLVAFERSGARLLPQARYVALERPDLFADHDHLDARGSVLFSAMLGRDVDRALRAAPVAVEALAPEGSAPVTPHLLRNLIGIGNPLEFSSYEFWIFVALVAALFYAVPRRLGRYVLLAASYYFYARWNAWYVVFLLALTVSDYLIGLALERADRLKKPLLFAGVAANLAFLGTFKYANFAGATIAALARMHQDPWLVSWIVPIGISFHTFQSISYLVDVYRKRMPATRNPFDYALFLAFFPQLLAGPIVRAELFFAELFAWRKPSAHDVTYGLARIAFGLLKKTAIADQFAAASDAYFGGAAAHPGSLAAWTATFAFAMQIYFDFSGYSDIAIGCARLFGFVFPENFRQPYLATSIGDFWHRWHITLSTWLRDYLYIPLGGSRDGTVLTLRNLMLTMLLGGLWHGAQWTFVAWGGYQGALLCIERLAGVSTRRAAAGVPAAAFKILITFALVCLGWVLFRAQHFSVALEVYRAMFSGVPGASMLAGWTAALAAGIVAFGVARFAYGRRSPDAPRLAFPPLLQGAALGAMLFALEIFSRPGTAPPFIYFKF